TSFSLAAATTPCPSRALHDALPIFTLALGPRDRIVIVGPNGAGKSTLLDIIAGLLKPGAGSVTIAPSARIGYLDQDGRSLPRDRSESTRLNSSHVKISYAVFCLKKK